MAASHWIQPIVKLHDNTYDAIDPKQPALSTKDKPIFVTGGGTGLGPHLARGFAASGARFIGLSGRNVASLASTKTSLESSFPGLQVSTYTAELTDRAALDAAFADFAGKVEGGKIAVLVANAGYLPTPGSILGSDGKDYWQTFETNIRGNFEVVRAFKEHAVEKATIVHVSTFAPIFPVQYMANTSSAYVASKLASTKLFEFLQAEQPDWDVYNVHPGILATPMAKKTGYEGPFDKPELPAHFSVWLASGQGRFLRGKLVLANWDVEELQAKEAQIAKNDNWIFNLRGFPALTEHNLQGTTD